jgi:imidazolonepropionase-like amidohydrolase
MKFLFLPIITYLIQISQPQALSSILDSPGKTIAVRHNHVKVAIPFSANFNKNTAFAHSQIVLTHITVIDTKNGRALPDRNVVIEGGRILAVKPGSTVTTKNITVIDGHGKFVIPGLWDMHIHLSWTTQCALPLLVALGITDVRDMGGNLTQLDDWRSRIAVGALVGPHIVRVGPILNGKSFNAYQMVPGSPEATRGAVRTLKFIGVDAIKVHRRLPRDSYFAATDEAKKLGIPLVGHVPMEVTPLEASNAGQATIEHTETLFEGTFSAKLTDEELPGAITAWLNTRSPDTLFSAFVKNGTWVTPTLSGYLEVADMYDPNIPRSTLYRYVALSQRKIFDKQLKEHPFSKKEVATTHAHMAGLVATTARMYKDGVMMLAGTDAAGPRLVGFSLHTELADMVKIGMTPAEALQTATLNPARALGKTTDFGTVEPGKVADLVILNANPLNRIENTRAIFAVLLDGKLYRSKDLHRLLIEAQKLAASN